MEQHFNQGIKYSADGNPYPIVSVDASNKPDGDDGCAIGGHVITMMGGPQVGKSYKHKHNGLSSEQNEYMAITGALRLVVLQSGNNNATNRSKGRCGSRDVPLPRKGRFTHMVFKLGG
jgi:hypothetical protein